MLLSSPITRSEEPSILCFLMGRASLIYPVKTGLLEISSTSNAWVRFVLHLMEGLPSA